MVIHWTIQVEPMGLDPWNKGSFHSKENAVLFMEGMMREEMRDADMSAAEIQQWMDDNAGGDSLSTDDVPNGDISDVSFRVVELWYEEAES